MKYGLITYQDTENIGDDIQSYAAIRFLPKIDYYIEREKMDLFLPKQKEQVITIMNGWYLHSKINFPMSPYIFPLFISTHFSAYDNGGIKTEYLNKYSAAYLNKYGPIGCRDHGTMELLDNCKIKNYFSGCLTLTIEPDKNLQKKDYICIVDIEEQAEKYLIDNIDKKTKIVKKTHILNREKNKQIDWETRFNNVKELLDTYQSAKLVITSRLHCALPCLALGTPVLLLYDEEKEYTRDRLSDYAKILNHMSTKDFIENGINIVNDGIKNPEDYIKIKTTVEKKLKDLLNNTNKKIDNNLPELLDYKKNYVEPKKNIDMLYNVAVSNMEISKRDYINLKHQCNYWKKEYKELEQKTRGLFVELERIESELNLIKNSKLWNLLEKLRKKLNLKNSKK